MALHYRQFLRYGVAVSGGLATLSHLVRFGSQADICNTNRHVRFTPESGHVRCTSLCLLWANSGHCIYSITSSARATGVGRIVTPNALAVFNLTTRSNLAGCSTGRSLAQIARVGALQHSIYNAS